VDDGRYVSATVLTFRRSVAKIWHIWRVFIGVVIILLLIIDEKFVFRSKSIYPATVFWTVELTWWFVWRSITGCQVLLKVKRLL